MRETYISWYTVPEPFPFRPKTRRWWDHAGDCWAHCLQSQCGDGKPIDLIEVVWPARCKCGSHDVARFRRILNDELDESLYRCWECERVW